MGIRLKHGLKFILFCFLLVVVIGITQRILVYKCKYPIDNEDHLGRVKEFDSLAQNSVDVIYLGTSHAMYGISPMQIYEETGVVSYNLASSLQSMELSYTLLERSLKKQSPKIVMLDVSALFLNSFENSSWRKMLDGSKTDWSKIDAARAYATAYTNKSVSEQTTLVDKLLVLKQKGKAALSIIFPLYYYHNRWSKLVSYDFSDVNQTTLTKGYYLSSWMMQTAVTVEQMNEITEELLQQYEITEKIYSDGIQSETTVSKSLYSVNIADENMGYLNAIAELCTQNGVKLVLVKVPSVENPRIYKSAWTDARSKKVKQIAQNMGIDFIDLLYDSDLSLDLSRDFSDAGSHLNYNGAKAVSECLGKYLTDTYRIQPRTNGYYEETLVDYKNIVNTAELQLENSFDRYLEKLNDQKENIAVFMAVKNNVEWISESELELLKQLGAKYAVNSIGTSYVLAVDQGENIFEKSSDQKIEIEGLSTSIGIVNIESIGNAITTDISKEAHILVDGEEYAEDATGLNIVVVDCVSNTVIDSVVFYADYNAEVKCKRSNCYNLMKAFEHWQYERIE